jgi:hypothetical protein
VEGGWGGLVKGAKIGGDLSLASVHDVDDLVRQRRVRELKEGVAVVLVAFVRVEAAKEGRSTRVGRSEKKGEEDGLAHRHRIFLENRNPPHQSPFARRVLPVRRLFDILDRDLLLRRFGRFLLVVGQLVVG